MKSEKQRLARLRKLEKVRAIARQNALADAARAEGALSHMTALARRTRLLADDYARRADAANAADLARLLMFASGMQTIIRTAETQADNARNAADLHARAVAEAERRRAAVQDRADQAARDLARRQYGATLSTAARKGNWHGS